MAVKWSTLRDFIRLAILKDSAGTDPSGAEINSQFSNDQLLVAARWACSAISMHTAEKATMSFIGDGQRYQFDLPDNMVDGVEKAALVYYIGQDQEVLPPMRMLPSERWAIGVPTSTDAAVRAYWEWPNDTLTLSFIPAADERIEVRYFKTWDAPEADDSLLMFPRQFEAPFAYLVGAFAFEPLGAQASAIRTWNRKSDSGNPEDNSLQKQSIYFREQAQECLNDIGPQDRETFYKIGHRDFGFTR